MGYEVLEELAFRTVPARMSESLSGDDWRLETRILFVGLPLSQWVLSGQLFHSHRVRNFLDRDRMISLASLWMRHPGGGWNGETGGRIRH